MTVRRGKRGEVEEVQISPPPERRIDSRPEILLRERCTPRAHQTPSPTAFEKIPVFEQFLPECVSNLKIWEEWSDVCAKYRDSIVGLG